MKQPKIRLKGFEGEWKSLKLNSITKRVVRKNKNMESDLALTISSQYGLISQKEFFNTLVVGANICNYYLIENGEFAYNKSSSSGYPVGSVKRLDRYDKGILSTLYILFALKDGVSSDYITHYFDTKLWYNEVFSRAEEGARNHGLLNIGADDFLDININLPSLPEQTAIAKYFTALDGLIQATAKELEKLRTVKAASLQSLFPQEGETVPKIRFKGFEGEWKRVKIGDVARFSKGRGYSKSDIKDNGIPIILYGRLYTNYQTIIKSVETYATLCEGSVLSQGNEVIIPASGETPEDIAIASFVAQKGVILGGDLNILTFDSEMIIPAFAALSITGTKTHLELSSFAQGKTVVHLHNKNISKGHIEFPSIEEQTAIAKYFTALDEQIQATAKRLEKLRNIKAACLDNMFV
ncbi:MAG: restriction endonuclease subunit S [Bacteroidales bacterium]|nr:restriction endonuclease subunit S [Bacteroidales bacterium]